MLPCLCNVINKYNKKAFLHLSRTHIQCSLMLNLLIPSQLLHLIINSRTIFLSHY